MSVPAPGSLGFPAKTREASISIEGVELTFSQSMTLRVALETFAMTLHDTGLGDDKTGKALTAGYLERVREIRALIFRGAK